VKNVVLVDKQLTIQFLSQTHAGSMHNKRIADATPYPLPPGSHLLQDLRFLAFTLEGVIIDIPRDAQRDVLSAQGASLAPSKPTLFLCTDQKELCLLEAGESGRMR